MKSRLFFFAAVLCSFGFNPLFGQNGLLERQPQPVMKSSSVTDGRIYKDNVLICDDPSSESRELYVNHEDTLQIETDITAYCSAGDEDGSGNALANANHKSTCSVAINDPQPAVTMESSSSYFTYVHSTPPYYTEGPEFRSEADANGNTEQSSDFKLIASNDKTLESTITLDIDWPEGDTEISSLSYVKAVSKNSEIYAVRFNSSWLVVGHLEQTTTSDPNAAPIDLYYFIPSDTATISYLAKEVTTPQNSFTAKTYADGAVNAKSTDHGLLQDETTWNLSAKLIMSISN